jgi:hypothetical protein
MKQNMLKGHNEITRLTEAANNSGGNQEAMLANIQEDEYKVSLK